MNRHDTYSVCRKLRLSLRSRQITAVFSQPVNKFNKARYSPVSRAFVAFRIVDKHFEIVFHARTREDLEKARELRAENPKIHGVLASFGVMVPGSVLEVFEQEGILNIHHSLLPLYRGASPIESAILDGCSDFSVSVMKLVKAMDAGPIYWQTTFSSEEIAEMTGSELVSGLIPEKSAIYKVLAEAGAEWICEHLTDLPEPVLQDDTKATFCGKLDKSMGVLTPEIDSAEKTLRIRRIL